MGADRAEPRELRWTRPMELGSLAVVAGSVASFAIWVTWTSPGNVTALFATDLVGNFSAVLARLLGPVPGSHRGVATGPGMIGVLLASAVAAIAVATGFTKGRRALLVLCACGLVSASLGLVVDAAIAVNETVSATTAVDHDLRNAIAATADLPSLPVVGSISDDLDREGHMVRRHVVAHSVRPALLGLAAGALALLGSLTLLAGVLRRDPSRGSRVD